MVDWTQTRAALFERMDAATRFAVERRADFPRIDEIDLAEHRAIPAEMVQRAVDAGRTEVAPGASVEEVEIPGPGGPIPTFVYVPDGDAPYSILYTIHAGGFVAGAGLSPAMHPHLSGRVAQFGCAVVHPGCRRSTSIPLRWRTGAAVDR